MGKKRGRVWVLVIGKRRMGEKTREASNPASRIWNPAAKAFGVGKAYSGEVVGGVQDEGGAEGSQSEAGRGGGNHSFLPDRGGFLPHSSPPLAG